ncbi:sensor histidine kinase [Chloroflexota bacterium]
MDEVTFHRRILDVLGRREFHRAFIIFLFVYYSMVYYFGELIDFFGWEVLRWDFFYGVHDVHRLLFFIPIIYASYVFRIKWGLLTALGAFIVFLPRALLITPFADPILRVVLFDIAAFVLAVITGIASNEYERRKRLEALIKRERDGLVELNQLKSDLLSNVSHELRSPLTSIKGIVTSLLQKDITLDDTTRETLLTGISEETDRLASLVTNLLNMSRLEAGVWKPEKESCYITDIINEVIERQQWVRQKYPIETDLKPDLPEIYADSNQIKQVLINLIENATAYSEEGAGITVGAEAVNGMVEVSVSDRGVGIPEEDLPKLFDKFYRGNQNRQQPGGTGLGLAVSQAIIQTHDGRIWAESKVGEGSTFYFRLPVARKGKK